MDNETLKTIRTRRTVRHFLNEPVSAETLETLCRAAMCAPSACNKQMWQFVVVTERADLDAMAAFLPSAKMLAQAPAAIVVCGNSREFGEGATREMWVQDCSAATENILLAAEGIGLGAVWIGIAPVRERMNAISDLFDLTENMMPFCIVAVGYPKERPQPHTDRNKPERVHYNGY